MFKIIFLVFIVCIIVGCLLMRVIVNFLIKFFLFDYSARKRAIFS